MAFVANAVLALNCTAILDRVDPQCLEPVMNTTRSKGASVIHRDRVDDADFMLRS